MLRVRPVREVQASNIHASTHELLELLFAAGRWTDRTDNFGASHRFSSFTFASTLIPSPAMLRPLAGHALPRIQERHHHPLRRGTSCRLHLPARLLPLNHHPQ